MKNDRGTTIKFRHQLPTAKLLIGKLARIRWISEYCSGKKVLHIGCADVGLTEIRVKKGELLHAKLTDLCEGVIGVDVNQEGIQKLKEFGFDNVAVHDITTSAPAVIELLEQQIKSCDIILCAEVIEHVQNVTDFLVGVREIAARFDSEVIISTPNAFNIRGFLGIIRGVEIVHSDHKCYFSWKTLDTLLNQAGLRITETLFYYNELVPTSYRNVIQKSLTRLVLRWYPYLGDGVICLSKSITEEMR